MFLVLMLDAAIIHHRLFYKENNDFLRVFFGEPESMRVIALFCLAIEKGNFCW